MASDNKGTQDLTDIKGDPTYVIDIWLVITSFGIDCGTGAESCGSKGLLARDQHLLQIFGQCRSIFSGSTSVGDIDSPNRSNGEDMPCGYVGIR